MESLQQLKASGEGEWGTEYIKTEMVDTDHHNNNKGKAGADITIDKFLQFLIYSVILENLYKTSTPGSQRYYDASVQQIPLSEHTKWCKPAPPWKKPVIPRRTRNNLREKQNLEC